MALNCKQGDLAVIVNSLAGNEGKFVTCVEFVGLVCYWADATRTAEEWLPTWRIDRELPNAGGYSDDLFPDCWLRPIRDNPGEDETLTWAGKPAETVEQILEEARGEKVGA